MAAIDPSYQLLACQYLRKQLDALIKQVRGVRENKEIEPVHQARVASRRMRAALSMFADCFGAKQVNKWQKRIRKLTKGLGAARDLDVQIEFLDLCLARLDEKDKRYRPGVERLLLRLRQDRDTVQPKVVKTLDALEKGNAMAEMHGELEKVLFLLRNRDVSLQSPYVYERAAAHIGDRQRDLLAHGQTLADPQNAVGHHQVRIGAKRLRYTLEICDPAYDKQLVPAIKVVKKVQSLLGDIHDCDVWAERVEAFTEQERLRTIEYFGHHGPFNRLGPGLQLLIDERRRHREEAFAELAEFWQRLSAEQFWDHLDTKLKSYIEVSPPTDVEPQDPPIHGTEEEINTDRPD
jgi:CHAD domain-containing protein